jgi:hypothetical protein
MDTSSVGAWDVTPTSFTHDDDDDEVVVVVVVVVGGLRQH